MHVRLGLVFKWSGAAPKDRLARFVFAGGAGAK